MKIPFFLMELTRLNKALQMFQMVQVERILSMGLRFDSTYTQAHSFFAFDPLLDFPLLDFFESQAVPSVVIYEDLVG